MPRNRRGSIFALGPTQALGASQPKGTRDGTRGMVGRKVWIVRCASERCGNVRGAFVTKAKARRRAKQMEREDGCIPCLEEFTCR